MLFIVACDSVYESATTCNELNKEHPGSEFIVLYSHDNRVFFPRGTILCQDKMQWLMMIEKKVSALSLGAPVGFVSSELPSQFMEGTVRIARSLVSSIKTRQATASRFMDKWILQTIKNYDIMCDAPNAMQMKFKNIPCVVIGPGVSLEDHVGEDFRLPGVLTLAISRAKCSELGFTPHFVITVDSGTYIVDENLSIGETNLITDFSVDTNLLQMPFKNIVSVASHGILDTWLTWLIGKDIVPVDAMSTVGFTAFMLAYHWGCDPIVFVGMDFCEKDKQSYAFSTEYKVRNNTVDAPGLSNNFVTTTTDMLNASFAIGSHAVIFDERRYINCSNGVFIDGFCRDEYVNIARKIRNEHINITEIIDAQITAAKKIRQDNKKPINPFKEGFLK